MDQGTMLWKLKILGVEWILVHWFNQLIRLIMKTQQRVSNLTLWHRDGAILFLIYFSKSSPVYSQFTNEEIQLRCHCFSMPMRKLTTSGEKWLIKNYRVVSRLSKIVIGWSPVQFLFCVPGARQYTHRHTDPQTRTLPYLLVKSFIYFV